MNSASITGKKVKIPTGSSIEVARGEFRKEATMFMLQLIRGRLSLPDIEAHIVKPVDRRDLEKLRLASTNNEVPYPLLGHVIY